MSAPAVVRELVDRFPSKRTPSFQTLNETSVRREFLDPFFAALGWDVENTRGNPADYKEVIHEDRIRIPGGKKRLNEGEDETDEKRGTTRLKMPDYAFRLGGKRKFFVEAKRPTSRLRSDPKPARQLRRYGWSAKLPLGVVTDFQEFCVYDCRQEPRATDNADVALKFYVPYEEYEQQWDQLYGLFSREAVLDGALERYAEEAATARGTKTVDQAFLGEMQSWRLSLAKNIAQRNPTLTASALNYAVQMTLDRLLFLRVAEDRGIEPYEQLKLLVEQSNPYGRLCALFRDADDKYNSGLFHFTRERGRLSPEDDLTLGLTIDDKPLREIVEHLYYPYPYEFGMIPVEIMGQVYEQFLGQVIHVDEHRKVRLEEKPEVRKAGGVYYTPQYVVEYMVDRVLGGVLEGKTPQEVSKLRVLDPACGSGSFLVGAYRYLLEWHRSRYILEGVRKHKDELYQDIYGDWQLTTQERKRILLNNIFGVDIDPYAVEVAKLSLLLVVLEGATDEGLVMQLRFAHERALPDLDKNIKCGNSLISPDHPKLTFLTDAELYEVNPLDWYAEFPEVMSQGRFSVILGNPPYIRIQGMKEWAKREVELYKDCYVAASRGNYDKYTLFVERSLELLGEGGELGLILPHKFFNAEYGEPLRNLLAQGRYVSGIVHFGDQQVFADATTYTALLFLSKSGSSAVVVDKVNDLGSWRYRGEASRTLVDGLQLTGGAWNFDAVGSIDFFDRMPDLVTNLGKIARIFQGLVTGADKVFIVSDLDRGPGSSPGPEGLIKVKDRNGTEWLLEEHLLKPFLNHVTVSTFEALAPAHRLIFPYHVAGDRATLVSPTEMKRSYPRTWEYLLHHKETLTAREGGKWDHDYWYAFGRTQNLAQMTAPKLVVQVISQHARYAYDDTGIHFTGGGNGPYYGVRFQERDDPHSLHYLQAVLNSPVIDALLHQISSPFRGGYWSYGKRFIERLPIRLVDFLNRDEMRKHDEIVDLVKRLIFLNTSLSSEPPGHARTRIVRRIQTTKDEVNAIVYDLYGLSQQERQVVERHVVAVESATRK
ncbi:MAG TPA: N-6 DNA methylase [Chloroflexia bacterium]|jgi:hypothetical protein